MLLLLPTLVMSLPVQAAEPARQMAQGHVMQMETAMMSGARTQQQSVHMNQCCGVGHCPHCAYFEPADLQRFDVMSKPEQLAVAAMPALAGTAPMPLQRPPIRSVITV